MVHKNELAKFLPDNSSVLERIQRILKEDDGSSIYIIGSAVKFIINGILGNIDKDIKDIHVALPSLSSKDFSNTSFLYQMNKLATNIRISPKAVHNILVSNSSLILISIVSKGREDQLSGIFIDDPQEIIRGRDYCHAIWSNGFPLDLR